MEILLDTAQLTESGRLVLGPAETEHIMLDMVDIQFTDGPGGIEGHTRNKHEGLQLVLTTHRLVWINARATPSVMASCALQLSCVREAHLKATHLWSTPKVRIHVNINGNGRPVGRLEAAVRVTEVRLVSRQHTQLMEHLHKALAQRVWERQHGQVGQAAGGAAPWLASGPALSPLGPASVQQPDPGLLGSLCKMGFPHLPASHALLATNNQGLEVAVSWLLAHEGDPLLQQPLPGGASPQVPPSGPAPVLAGVAGLLRREQEATASAERAMEDAFRDLRGLMAKAGEMVQLAARFRGTLGESASEGMDPEMAAQLISMGIQSPVTRESAGALFHQQLARQLADFLLGRPVAGEPSCLEKAGGIMPLPDVYCLFNRARGTELVSPDDLLAAVELFPKIPVPLSLRQFGNGVLVVQSASHSDAQVCNQLQQMLGEEGGLGQPISATLVSTKMGIPIAIASQHLLTAESRGVLCRDDGPEGLRFFRNFFSNADVWAC
eukprot:jgi/Botrbrau1/8596/Bobra.0380s0017.1